MKRLNFALFGGSFDPPHLGHKEIIKKALALDGVDCILIVPTFLNPFKNRFNLEPKKRYKLVKKSFSNLGCVKFSNYEIKQNRSVYTIETYKKLKRKFNIKFIIIGADNLKSIKKWKDFRVLNNNLTWIVATRGKRLPHKLPLKRYIILKVDVNVSSTQIREGNKLNFIDKKIKSQVVKYYLKG